MKVKWRFPFVLLTLVLVLALLVTGLVSPGFALPLFYPKDEGAAGTDALTDRQFAALAENPLAPDGTVLPMGKSAAFSVEPVAGITISAWVRSINRSARSRIPGSRPTSTAGRRRNAPGCSRRTMPTRRSTAQADRGGGLHVRPGAA